MTLHRAFSVLDCKQFDDEHRVIRGLATSPVPDRSGDVVDQYGAKFASTIPLFLHHDSRLTVGTVKLGRPTKEGIPFEASIPNVVEPGTVQTRTNEAWHSLKYKLIGCVSIGFRAIEDKVEQLKTGGLRFLECEILELSLVPIPMQSLATIHSLKSFDSSTRAMLGITSSSVQSDGATLTLRRDLSVEVVDSDTGAKTKVKLDRAGAQHLAAGLAGFVGTDESARKFFSGQSSVAIGAEAVEGKSAARIHRNGPMDKTQQLVDMVIDSTKSYLTRCLKPLGARIKAIEEWRANLTQPTHGRDADPQVTADLAVKALTPQLPDLIRASVTAALPGELKTAMDAQVDVVATRAAMLVPPGRDGLPGRPGTPGDHGKDGFSADDFSLSIKDGRTLVVTMQCGERTVTKSVTLMGFPIYRGIYAYKAAYAEGDLCTYAGSVWRAIRSTTEPPKGKNDSWTLVVKGAK